MIADPESESEELAARALAEARSEHLARPAGAQPSPQASSRRAAQWSTARPWLIATLFVLAIPHTLPGIGLFVASGGKVVTQRPACEFRDLSLECSWETGQGTKLVAHGWSPWVTELRSGACAPVSAEVASQVTF